MLLLSPQARNLISMATTDHGGVKGPRNSSTNVLSVMWNSTATTWYKAIEWGQWTALSLFVTLVIGVGLVYDFVSDKHVRWMSVHVSVGPISNDLGKASGVTMELMSVWLFQCIECLTDYHLTMSCDCHLPNPVHLTVTWPLHVMWLSHDYPQ